MMTIALMCATAQGAWAWDGSGTAESPYILANENSHWDRHLGMRSHLKYLSQKLF